ncbi:MAG: hypothetical protein ACRDVP_09110 [Acidimicrobiales bacterium]
MLFVEIFRLILVLIGALAGYEVGRSWHASSAQLAGVVLGALIAYVVGGILGRVLSRETRRAAERFGRIPPGELFAGTLTGIAGFLLGGALSVPMLVLVRSPIVWPAAAALAWVLTWVGFQIGVAKGRQVVAAAGLGRILAPPLEPPPGYALLVDSSAAMTPFLLVLGRYGLLVGGLVIPRFVIDQLQTLAAGPDPVGSRRARRGLERLDVLRDLHVPVHLADNELPEIDDITERLVEVARRLGLRLATCSGQVKETAKRRGVAVTDLRPLANDLTPDHLAGEQLVIDLVKEGNQPRQAAGYLADGDLVIVNDASHMIGRENVVIEVLSTRRTNQGLLVFAKLADRPQSAGPISGERALLRSPPQGESPAQDDETADPLSEDPVPRAGLRSS